MAEGPILVGLVDELGFVAPYRRATGRGGTEWVIPEIAYYSLVCRHALGDTKLANELAQEATVEGKEELKVQAAQATCERLREMVLMPAWIKRHAPKRKSQEEDAHLAENCPACMRASEMFGKNRLLAPGKARLVRYYRACIKAWYTPVFTGENVDKHLGLVDPYAGDRGVTAKRRIVKRAIGKSKNEKKGLQSEKVASDVAFMVENVCNATAAFYTSRLVGRLETGLVVKLAEGASLVNNPHLVAAEGRPGYARADLVRRGTVDTVSCAAVCMADLLAEKYGLAPSQLFNGGPGGPVVGAEDDEAKRTAMLCSQVRGPPMVLPRIIGTEDTCLDVTPMFHVDPDEKGNYLPPPDNDPYENVFGRLVEWLRMVALLARGRVSPRNPLYEGYVEDPALGYVKRGANAPPPRSLDDIIAKEPFVPVPVEEEIKRLTLEHKDEPDVPGLKAPDPSVHIPEVHLERVNLVPSLWPKPRLRAEYARHDPCSIFVVAAQ